MRNTILKYCLTYTAGLVLCNWTLAQSAIRPIAQMISDAKVNKVEFKKSTDLMQRNISDMSFKTSSATLLNEATFAKINLPATHQLYAEKNAAIELTIPYNNDKMLTLDLVKQDIFSDGFYVETSESNGTPVAYTPGVYYRGTIKDNPNSIVAISIFDDEIYGIVSTDGDGNINIGKYHGPDAGAEDYVIFSDRDFLATPSTSCATVDDEKYLPQLLENLNNTDGSRTANTPRVYLEADYGLEQNKGSVANTANFLTAIFNNSSTIYANDLINISLQEIFVWTTNDGYATASSYSALTSFKNYRSTFNGDVAQLCALDPGGLGGVAATINGLCNSNKYCYSDIDATYSSFPTYSWTVMVFTHEMGHLFGSYHTHNCSWPGGAIDNCYTTEGGCAAGPAPVTGGTIMSYCHLTGYGINFNNGFGPLPGDAIRNTIDAAACLGGGGVVGPTYCASNGLNASEEWIDLVKLASINRVSGSDAGYYNAAVYTTNMPKGVTKNIKVSAGMSGGPWTEYWKAWIDYNHDGDFSDVGEEVFSTSSSSTGTLTGNITVPYSALSGTTRMRVSMKYAAAPSPCESFSYGEVEDYTINITSGLPHGLEAPTFEVNVSPNPTLGNFNVEYIGAGDAGIDIYIYDITGKEVGQQHGDNTNGFAQCSISKLPAGLYFVKTKTQSGEINTTQLIKQ